jgi:hypothetical protein
VTDRNLDVLPQCFLFQSPRKGKWTKKKVSVATEEILASVSVMAAKCINRFKNLKIPLSRKASEDLQDKLA